MTSVARLGIADVKPALQARCAELVKALCPGARREGDHWVCPNPRRGEDKGGSFIVWTNGAWKEYDAGDAEKGDVIDLLIYTGQCADRAGALAWAKKWLGLDNADAPEIIRLREQAKAADAAAVAAEARRREAMMKAAQRIWLGAKPLTPSDYGWIYLEDARGIPLRELFRLQKGALSSLRFHPRLSYLWPKLEETPVEWRVRRPRSGPNGLAEEFLPAIVSCMSPINGGPIGGMHRTYLDRDGLGKAKVIKAKKMMGQQLGCAIKLWRGESGLSARDAAKRGAKGPLAVTEGIENGLSIACASPGHRVWALGSLAGLMSMEWHPCISELTIFRDNDWNNPTAREQVETAAARLAQHGPVKLANSPIGKDANDLLNA